jgi:hypothetical protein
MAELPRGMWNDLGNGVKIFEPGETADDIRKRLREAEERRLARMKEFEMHVEAEEEDEPGKGTWAEVTGANYLCESDRRRLMAAAKKKRK